MKRWTKRRVESLMGTVEIARLSAAFASSILVNIEQEWNPRKGTTQEERNQLIEALTDAKTQIDMALEDLEG